MKLNKRLIGICFAFFTLLCYTAQAQVSLATPFTDHMVLQQKTDAPIWGWGTPGEQVKLVGSWSVKDTVKVVVNSSGCWNTKIKTLKAGGPYTLKVLGSNEIELKDVMIGEVWICSGQSNMSWSHLTNLFNQEKEIAAANHPNLRIFHVEKEDVKTRLRKQGATTPQDSCVAQWEQCTPTSMKRTSAVGYFFARELMQKMDVPIGIIVSAWGGTAAELWLPKDSVMSHPVLNSSRPLTWLNKKSGVLYNQMINPIVPYALSGAIWYQGESNILNSESYGLLMKKLIESWRSAFEKELPFYFVQIAPFSYNNKFPLGAATIREQQELTSKTIPKTGMIVVNDFVDDIKNIHPRNKLDVGIRLANMAMADTYKMPIKGYLSPTYKSVKFNKNKAYISLNDVVTDIEIRGEKAVGFMIATDDGKFVPAVATVKNGVVIVYAKGIKKPVAVRYCFDNATIGNIFSKEGLPLAPFRTDNRTSMMQ